MRPRAAAVGTLLALVVAAPAGAAVQQRFFLTPAPLRASCEIDAGVPGLPTTAFCLADPGSIPSRAVSATLSASGAVRSCRGVRCLGNAPEHTPVLATGRSATLGAFRCTSLVAAVRCVVAKTGRGFVLRASGVRRL
jgi:hypothetical protein